MIECYIAWFMLVLGLVKSDGLYLIASGVFACAAHFSGIKEHLSEIKKRMREVDDG